MTRYINLFVCFAVLSGVMLYIPAQFKLVNLRKERERLLARHGVLDVKNPNKFYVKRVQTMNEKDYLWRIYRPGGSNLHHKEVSFVGQESGSLGTIVDGREFLYRCRFVLTNSGIEIHSIGGHGTSGGKWFAEFIEEHWSELEIDVIANGEHSADKVLRLLTIRIPPPLVAELMKKDALSYKYFQSSPMFEVSYWTDVANPESIQ